MRDVRKWMSRGNERRPFADLRILEASEGSGIEDVTPVEELVTTRHDFPDVRTHRIGQLVIEE